MRGVRPTLPLVIVAIALLGGCLPRTTSELPASFTEERRAMGQTFELAPQPTAPMMSAAEVVAALRNGSRGNDGALLGATVLGPRAIPIYGVLRCTGASACADAEAAGGTARAVWVVIFPDWVVASGDVGWAIADVATESEFGFRSRHCIANLFLSCLHDPRAP